MQTAWDLTVTKLKPSHICQIQPMLQSLNRFWVLSAMWQTSTAYHAFPAQEGTWVGVEWCTKGAVKRIKAMLISALALAYFDVSQPWCNSYGLRAALLQDHEGELKPMAFWEEILPNWKTVSCRRVGIISPAMCKAWNTSVYTPTSNHWCPYSKYDFDKLPPRY